MSTGDLTHAQEQLCPLWGTEAGEAALRGPQGWGRLWSAPGEGTVP